MTKTLTTKQTRFCEEYVVDGNGTGAAIRAGYSRHTAQVIASQNLSKVMVAARIRELLDAVAQRAAVTATKTLTAIADIAFSDVAELFDDEGKLLHPNELSEGTRGAVAHVRLGKNAGDADGPLRTVEVVFADKLAALEKLARHLGLYERDNRQSADGMRSEYEGLPTELRAEIRVRLQEIIDGGQ